MVSSQLEEDDLKVRCGKCETEGVLALLHYYSLTGMFGDLYFCPECWPSIQASTVSRRSESRANYIF